jgi:hypothetical protein
MSPKAKATRQIGSRTKSAKKTAEQTPATARRTTRSNPATAAAEPSSILKEVLDTWDALSAPEQTPANAVLITAEVCRASDSLTNSSTYTGAVKLSREVPFIPQSILELYCCMRTKAGVPISEQALECALFPEYATNLCWVNGNIKVVTNKYVGMEFLPGVEAVMASGDDNTVSPSEVLVDLLYNCMKLELCTLAEIKEFVEQGVWVGAKAYLLSDDDVTKLVKYGTHEKFDASAVEDSIMVARDCVKLLDGLFPKIQTISWAPMEEVPNVTEYYACE